MIFSNNGITFLLKRKITHAAYLIDSLQIAITLLKLVYIEHLELLFVYERLNRQLYEIVIEVGRALKRRFWKNF